MRARLALVLLLGLSGPAFAGGKPAAGGKEAVGGHIDLAPFGAPVIVDGRVVNYVFVSIRLHTPTSAEADPHRSKEPRLRAALVRASHKQPLNPGRRRSEVDVARTEALALAEAKRIAGVKAFSRAEVRRQMPQRHLPDS